MSNSIKLVFSDIDGTLLNKERSLATQTITEVNRLSKLSVPFILISSRMPRAMYYLSNEFDKREAIACYNGSLIIDQNGKTLLDESISPEIALDTIQLVESQDTHISIYHNDDWYVNKMDEWAKREINNTRNEPILSNDMNLFGQEINLPGAHKMMVMGDKEKLDFIVETLDQKYGDKISLYRSKDTYIEINIKTASKARAIDILAKTYSVKIDEIMAFGDNVNDIEMLQHVGCGVAVKNARPALMAVANEVTDSNIENGVANRLEKIKQ